MVVINSPIVLVLAKVSAEVPISVERGVVGLPLSLLDSVDKIPDIVSREMLVALISSCKGFVCLEVPSIYLIR